MATAMRTPGEPESARRLDCAQAPPARARTPVELAGSVLGGRYSAPILWSLFWGGKGFYQVFRELDGVPRRALALEFERLEQRGLVARSRVANPARVEYSLTRLGRSLRPLLALMYEWGLAVGAAGLAAELAGEEPLGPRVAPFRVAKGPSSNEGACEPATNPGLSAAWPARVRTADGEPAGSSPFR
jgi:DNA-binding HxlR family transcriptional regulator